jgi:hypothetical protein
MFQIGNDDIVEAGKKSHHEEQGVATVIARVSVSIGALVTLVDGWNVSKMRSQVISFRKLAFL